MPNSQPSSRPSLQVALVQLASTLVPEENRGLLDAVRTASGDARAPADLVVFPEAFARDFGDPGSDISGFAENMDGPFVQRLTELAMSHQVTIVAGMFERSEDHARPYNTLAVVDRHGLQATYRKMHLYDSFGYKESERLLPGEIEPVIVDVLGFRIGLMTCYDLRFPELARELVQRGAALLVVPSAWVAGPGKVDHWQTLVKARAIENTVYVAAAGQPGPRYTGHSMIVSPTGEVLAEAGVDDLVAEARVEHEVLEQARARNPSLANRRF
ncbi:MAG TPA: carbon-nitrogen hydrolase family protein [Nocardioidaceae bacterium]|nr:carbon-nitrogen hydrolase family protein [Nocardioidaceae bacterium]